MIGSNNNHNYKSPKFKAKDKIIKLEAVPEMNFNNEMSTRTA